MIRRQITRSGNQLWALISQIEHARISGELATSWGNQQVAALICADNSTDEALRQVRWDVLRAIFHHDDGWKSWGLKPDIDQEHHRPYAFTEMPLEDSLEIWSRSIQVASDIGPLAGWMVSGHFLKLLEGSSSQDLPIAKAWTANKKNIRAEWLAEWQTTDAACHTAELASTALLWLRCFDALSLWLCCGTSAEFEFPPAKPNKLPIPAPMEFRELSCDGMTIRVTADPWSFDSRRLSLATKVFVVPAGKYKSSDQLLEAAREETLRWEVSADDE